MSRLRRLLTTRRIFFVTTHFAQKVLPISPQERDVVLRCLRETQEHRGVVLMAYVVMPTHVHLLFAPKDDDSVGAVMREFKVRAAKQIARSRSRPGHLWQARFFDRIVRHPKEWRETIDYIHGNPVKDGLVEKSSQWPWSSWPGYQSGGGTPPVPVDIPEMPLGEYAPLGW